MIAYTIERDAVPRLGTYMEHVRAQIVIALRNGMRKAMTDLAAWIVQNKLSGNPIGRQAQPGPYTKPGDLAQSILHGVRIGGNQEEVYGSLSGRPKKMPNLGYWQEFGTNHPAVSGKLNVFIGRDGAPVFTHHLAAFSIAPRPFLNPSLEEQKAQIVETIRANLAAADLT